MTGDPEALVREILELARRESAGILAAAEAEAAEILAAAEEAAVKVREGTARAALAEAALRREALLAAVPAEAGRLRSDGLEARLEAIKAEALRMLPGEAARAGKPAILASLAAQAVGRMDGRKFTVVLAPADRAAAAGLAREIERRAGRGPLEIAMEEDQGLDGGVIVRDAQGRQRWDNTFKARLERFWPELRGRLLGEDK